MKRGFLQKKNVTEKKKEKQPFVIRKEENKKEESDKHYVDIISSMPDDIIYHIFSFLDMKQAVQTCVLSTKWRKFWVSLPTVSISDQFWRGELGELREDAFENFVNKVLLPSGSDIKKFHLFCPSYDTVTYRIDAWAKSVVWRNVEHLHLQEMFMPRVSSFTSATNLKTLELKFVRLSEEMEGSWFGSVLENLILENCFYDSVKKLVISSPRLKYLMVKSLMDSEHSDMDSCEIKICAPNLKFLGCLGFMYKNYDLENLSSLETAHIDTDCLLQEEDSREMIKVCGTCLKNILKGLMNAKSLTLSLEGIQGFAGLPNMLKQVPESFPNLKYLKLKEWRTDLYMDGMAKLFRIFSCIETLVITKALVKPEMYTDNNVFGFDMSLAEAMEEVYGPTNKGDWDKKLAPNSVFQKLRSVEIHYIKCTENEFDFVEFLLKCASVLENIRITTIKPRSNSKEFKYSEFGKKIQSLPRASSSATLSFVQPK